MRREAHPPAVISPHPLGLAPHTTASLQPPPFVIRAGTPPQLPRDYRIARTPHPGRSGRPLPGSVGVE